MPQKFKDYILIRKNLFILGKVKIDLPSKMLLYCF